MPLLRLLALLWPVIVAMPVHSATLYKSIGPNGTVLFSDVPSPDARVVELRVLPDSASSPAPNRAAGLPRYEFPDYDAELARANAEVDLAEHALALARQKLWSPRDGLRLGAERMTPGDEARVEHYRKGVRIACQQLLEQLRERRAPAQLASR